LYFRRLDNSITEKFGIGKSTRITLYVILGVTSTIKTWFHCFWTWQWWKRRAGQESESTLMGECQVIDFVAKRHKV
jgi:hypothetical protein